ncbi:MAG: hypothetical protein ACYS1A_18570, partial [Planctomycetota bacterium]
MTKTAKIIIFGTLALIVIIGILFFVGRKPRSQDRGVGVDSLTVWGVVDAEKNWAGFVNQISTLTGVTLRYQQIPEDQYEQVLLDALAADEGPDIFAFHSTWLARHGNKIVVAPVEVISQKIFQETFVDTAFQDLVAE